MQNMVGVKGVTCKVKKSINSSEGKISNFLFNNNRSKIVFKKSLSLLEKGILYVFPHRKDITKLGRLFLLEGFIKKTRFSVLNTKLKRLYF